MKKIVGLFFLSIILVTPAKAAEVSLQLSEPDYNVKEIGTFKKATAFTFDFEGNFIVAEDQGKSFRVIKASSDGTKSSLVDRTSMRVTNLSFYRGIVYVVTPGQVYKIAKGKLSDVVSSLPTHGDYGNSNLVFVDGYMYFAIGTATNSGVVGEDNTWLKSAPSVKDISCITSRLTGVNIETDNFLTEKKDDKAVTGSFSTFNTPISAGQEIYGMKKCNGSILKADPKGNIIGVYASGLHNPKGLSVDDDGRLWVFDSGMEDRGNRPIKNSKDALYQVSENTWYGWPDFSSGLQVDQPPLLSDYPNVPPNPQAVFDLNQIRYFIVTPKKFLANSGLAQVSDTELQAFDLTEKRLTKFLNVTNAKIVQYKFGPDDKLYVLTEDSKGQSILYSVESSKTTSVAAVETTNKKSPAQHWAWGLMFGTLAGLSFFLMRNLKQPLKPL